MSSLEELRQLALASKRSGKAPAPAPPVKGSAPAPVRRDAKHRKSNFKEKNPKKRSLNSKSLNGKPLWEQLGFTPVRTNFHSSKFAIDFSTAYDDRAVDIPPTVTSRAETAAVAIRDGVSDDELCSISELDQALDSSVPTTSVVSSPVPELPMTNDASGAANAKDDPQSERSCEVIQAEAFECAERIRSLLRDLISEKRRHSSLKNELKRKRAENQIGGEYSDSSSVQSRKQRSIQSSKRRRLSQKTQFTVCDYNSEADQSVSSEAIGTGTSSDHSESTVDDSSVPRNAKEKKKRLEAVMAQWDSRKVSNIMSRSKRNRTLSPKRKFTAREYSSEVDHSFSSEAFAGGSEQSDATVENAVGRRSTIEDKNKKLEQLLAELEGGTGRSETSTDAAKPLTDVNVTEKCPAPAGPAVEQPSDQRQDPAVRGRVAQWKRENSFWQSLIPGNYPRTRLPATEDLLPPPTPLLWTELRQYAWTLVNRFRGQNRRKPTYSLKQNGHECDTPASESLELSLQHFGYSPMHMQLGLGGLSGSLTARRWKELSSSLASSLPNFWSGSAVMYKVETERNAYNDSAESSGEPIETVGAADGGAEAPASMDGIECIVVDDQESLESGEIVAVDEGRCESDMELDSPEHGVIVLDSGDTSTSPAIIPAESINTTQTTAEAVVQCSVDSTGEASAPSFPSESMENFHLPISKLLRPYESPLRWIGAYSVLSGDRFGVKPLDEISRRLPGAYNTSLQVDPHDESYGRPPKCATLSEVLQVTLKYLKVQVPDADSSKQVKLLHAAEFELRKFLQQDVIVRPLSRGASLASVFPSSEYFRIVGDILRRWRAGSAPLPGVCLRIFVADMPSLGDTEELQRANAGTYELKSGSTAADEILDWSVQLHRDFTTKWVQTMQGNTVYQSSSVGDQGLGVCAGMKAWSRFMRYSSEAERQRRAEELKGLLNEQKREVLHDADDDVVPATATSKVSSSSKPVTEGEETMLRWTLEQLVVGEDDISTAATDVERDTREYRNLLLRALTALETYARGSQLSDSALTWLTYCEVLQQYCLYCPPDESEQWYSQLRTALSDASTACPQWFGALLQSVLVSHDDDQICAVHERISLDAAGDEESTDECDVRMALASLLHVRVAMSALCVADIKGQLTKAKARDRVDQLITSHALNETARTALRLLIHSMEFHPDERFTLPLFAYQNAFESDSLASALRSKSIRERSAGHSPLPVVAHFRDSIVSASDALERLKGVEVTNDTREAYLYVIMAMEAAFPPSLELSQMSAKKSTERNIMKHLDTVLKPYVTDVDDVEYCPYYILSFLSVVLQSRTLSPVLNRLNRLRFTVSPVSTTRKTACTFVGMWSSIVYVLAVHGSTFPPDDLDAWRQCAVFKAKSKSGLYTLLAFPNGQASVAAARLWTEHYDEDTGLRKTRSWKKVAMLGEVLPGLGQTLMLLQYVLGLPTEGLVVQTDGTLLEFPVDMDRRRASPQYGSHNRSAIHYTVYVDCLLLSAVLMTKDRSSCCDFAPLAKVMEAAFKAVVTMITNCAQNTDRAGTLWVILETLERVIRLFQVVVDTCLQQTIVMMSSGDNGTVSIDATYKAFHTAKIMDAVDQIATKMVSQYIRPLILRQEHWGTENDVSSFLCSMLKTIRHPFVERLSIQTSTQNHWDVAIKLRRLLRCPTSLSPLMCRLVEELKSLVETANRSSMSTWTKRFFDELGSA